MSKEQDHSLIGTLAIIGGLYLLSNLAFSKKTRLEIGKRDNWTCQDDGCEKSYQTGWMVQASHWDHNKADPEYDTIEAGRIQCIEHHLKYHEGAQGREEAIGSCQAANNAAIGFLRRTEHRTNWFLKMLGGS